MSSWVWMGVNLFLVLVVFELEETTMLGQQNERIFHLSIYPASLL